jgi:hypothetical protein
MKSIACASVGALFLLTFAAAAQSGPSANGDFQFDLEGAAGAIQFDARTDADGTSRGQMLFTGTVDIPSEDVDGTGDVGSALSNVTFQVEFDCLAVDGNRAAMSGVITAASADGYAGQRAVLAVEDNGEGGKPPAPDTFTWGVYRSVERTWTPVDAEVPDDIGATLTWIATDAERTDDVGVPSNRSTVVDCRSFPLGAYTLASIPHGGGNVQVRP